MKLQLALAAAIIFPLSFAAEAQTTVPSSPAAPTPAALSPAQQANRDRIKGERETCRTQAESQGLKGEAVRTAVMECMGKTDPVVAKRMGCAQTARSKNLTGDDLKKSVRECMTGAG